MRFKKYLKSPFLWAFLIGIASLHLVKEMALQRRSAPDPLLIVPNWRLIDHHGQPFGQADLKGKVVIANFFFSSCPSICPKLTEAMKEVYQRVQDNSSSIEFISITVDPETDTPEVLTNYMNKYGINHPNWRCLTGTKKDIYDVVVNKMKVHMGEKEAVPGSPTSYDIPHLAHLALFDQQGALRGLFKTETIELAALVRAAKFLVEKGL